MPIERLVRLATATLQTAAFSSCLELYPRGMEAGRALTLGSGSLLGPKDLTVEDLRQRIASRYPSAMPIPDPPLLDDLLRETRIELVWDSAGANGRGCYHPRYLMPDTSLATTLPRHSTAPPLDLSASPEVETAHTLEELWPSL
jgi:hypothetical protein